VVWVLDFVKGRGWFLENRSSFGVFIEVRLGIGVGIGLGYGVYRFGSYLGVLVLG